MTGLLTVEKARLDGAMGRAEAHAPFLRLLLTREQGVAADLAAGRIVLDPRLDPALPVGIRLRRERRQLALAVGVGDLAGVLDLSAVTGALTRFADRALDEAIRTAIEERTPGAAPVGFAAIALGKQGSGELNYSSDIDPIFLFDPATLPHRPREEVEEAAVRIGRRVVELLQARDGEGYVLRVDLRLRPSPEVTPIVVPVEAAIGYYESQALAWERAAFIRARAAAGDVALGEAFLAAIRPFVWRRALDFGAIGEVRDLSRRIRDHYAQGQALGPGYDLKRGRGGIREAEFFAQAHQLIHGGRDPALRAPATLEALARLAEAGRIDAGEAAALAEGYALLRTIEHRVQMVDDRQTHSLPAGEALDGVARLHGLGDGGALIELLRPHVEAIGRAYDALDEGRPAAVSFSREGLAGELAAMGFADGAEAAGFVARWRGGTYASLRSPAARAALEAVLPTLLPALAAAPDARGALVRFDNLVERLPSAINIFRLLEARPGLAGQLAAILSHAPVLAEALARQPALLDGLIDASAMGAVASVEELAAAMRGGEAADYGARLDHVRRVVGEGRFALGAQIVAGSSDPLEVAAGYARLAEAATEVLAGAAVAEFEAQHGRVAGSELVVLALGRFGGGALTHASDLDLVYLFTGDFRTESDGAKPLGATLYFNRLAQRVTAALSVATGQGPLYPVDTRLRPQGAQGPLAVSVESWAKYLADEAWTWEHMALTRARPVFGSAGARREAWDVIAAVLGGERRERDVVADARSMRAEMAAHKPPRGSLDAKLLPGGLIDLEFAVHVVQLVERKGFSPDLGHAIDLLVGDRLLPARMRRAHDFLTRLLVTLRLVGTENEVSDPATRELVARAVGLADWDQVVAWLGATRQEVEAEWARVAGG